METYRVTKVQLDWAQALQHTTNIPVALAPAKRNKRAEEAMVETPPVSMAGEATAKSKLLLLLPCPVAIVRP